MRKFTLNAYMQMIDFEDNILRNKYAVKGALGILKALKKVG